MTDVIQALGRATVSLLHPRMLLLCLAPLLLALLLWVVLGVLFWREALEWTQSSVVPGEWAHSVEQHSWAEPLLALGAGMLLVLLWVPAVWLTMLVIAAIVAMPWIVSHVAGRDYPGLERLRGGSFFGSLWNAVAGVLLFALLWLLTLPLWLLAGAGALAGLLVTGWATQRLLRYDALAEHASAAEMRLLIERLGGRLWLLGVVCALLALVPVVNLVAPIYAGLAVTHLCLMELAELRRDGVVVA